MKRIAIGTWAYLRGEFERSPLSLHAVLHKVEDAGYEGIELAAHAPHPTLASHDTQAKRQQVKKEVKDHGLALAGLACDLRSCKLVSVEDCGPYVAAFARHVLLAEDLGIGMLRVDTAEPLVEIVNLGLDRQVMFDRVRKAFGFCCRIAADRGLRVVWEFEPHLPFHEPAEIIDLVDAVRGQGHANFGVLFDTGHAHVCARSTLPGGERELVEKLGDRISHLHFADTDGTVNDQGKGQRVPLGKGKVNFDHLLPALLGCAGLDDWWVVDLGGCPDVLDAAAGARRFLDRMRRKYTVT